MFNTLDTRADGTTNRTSYFTKIVHRDCRRGEAQRDVAAALAAFDENPSPTDRMMNCVTDRMIRALKS